MESDAGRDFATLWPAIHFFAFSASAFAVDLAALSHIVLHSSRLQSATIE